MFIEVKKLLSPNSAEAGTIMLGDFADIESKELVEAELFREVMPKPHTWAGRCYLKTLQPPYESASYRSVVYPKAKDKSQYEMIEGKTPAPTGKLIFFEQTYKTKPYGFYQTYTDRDVKFGFDPIVPRLKMSVTNQASEVINQFAADAYFSGNQVWEATGGLTRELINRIRISLGKFGRKGEIIHGVLTPEDYASLRLKYNTAGGNLFQDLQLNEQSIVNAELGKFEGVVFETDDDPHMYNADGTTNAIFYTNDRAGRAPCGLISPDSVQGKFIAKALGSSGTEDPLDQRGSIGQKFEGLGACNTSEETLARVVITRQTGDIALVNSYYDYDSGDIYVDGKKVARENVRSTVASPNDILFVSGATKVKVGANTAALTVKDALGAAVTGATFASGSEDIATVAATGIVTGVAEGVAIISVTKGDKVGYIQVTVIAA